MGTISLPSRRQWPTHACEGAAMLASVTLLLGGLFAQQIAPATLMARVDALAHRSRIAV